MKILGFHLGHDSSVSLIEDEKILFNIQEERLNRIKHSASLPLKSLEQLFRTTGLSFKDIDAVAIPYLSRLPALKLLFDKNEIKSFRPESSGNGPIDILREFFIRSVISLVFFRVGGKLALPLYQRSFQIPSKIPVLHVDHHSSHAAAAYYTSGFDRCLIVTADGQGDYLSASAWLAEEGKLKPLIRIGRDGSLGVFYSIITEALGWQINEGEGKTMGLAPYGNYKKVLGKLDFIAPIFKDGKLVKSRPFGFIQGWENNGVVHVHFPVSKKVKKIIDRYGRENVAAEAQRVLEEQMLNFVVPWIKKTKATKLVAAGGVLLNVKMNQRIWETGLLEDFFIYPDAGDGGASVGAALYVYYNSDKAVYKPQRIKHIYWGVEYRDHYIEMVLKTRGLKYKKYTSKRKLVTDAAKLLANNKIIGWFQDRMESGPRALGNRSILMSPMKAENKDIINSRVKYREPFRPFCPSMTEKATRKYLVNPTTSPNFMIISFNVHKHLIKEIPAVVHVDGTCRPQVVTSKINPLFHQLISEFGRQTGVEVLLNTSFNIKGNPIVESPEDAIKCFYDTGLDYLFLGNFMLEK